MIRVFVSSVSLGLEATRKEIISDLQTVGYQIGAFESFGAQPHVPVDVCLREVRKADVVVLLIGPRYGSLLPQGITCTHAEFREAQGAGTPVLARLRLRPASVWARLRLARSQHLIAPPYGGGGGPVGSPQTK